MAADRLSEIVPDSLSFYALKTITSYTLIHIRINLDWKRYNDLNLKIFRRSGAKSFNKTL